MSAVPKAKRLRCSACGIEANCDCGAPYIPAGAYARRVVAINPEKSNRAIAAEIGVSPDTVDRARRATAGNQAVERTIGRDGKSRPALRVVSNSTDSTADMLPHKKRRLAKIAARINQLGKEIEQAEQDGVEACTQLACRLAYMLLKDGNTVGSGAVDVAKFAVSQMTEDRRREFTEWLLSSPVQA